MQLAPPLERPTGSNEGPFWDWYTANFTSDDYELLGLAWVKLRKKGLTAKEIENILDPIVYAAKKTATSSL